MTLNEMYPPRFKLVISGQEATKNAIAEISFTGSQEDLDTEILLELDGMPVISCDIIVGKSQIGW